MVKANYFTIEGPVSPDLFFDRREIIDYFERLLSLKKFRILIAFVAPFKFGKTSILLKLYKIASSYSEVIPILLRLNVVPDPIAMIFKEVEKALRKDILKYLKKVKKGDLSLYEAFVKVDEELSSADKWVILFIDEFQELPKIVKAEGFLERYPDEYIFEFFRGVVENFRFGLFFLVQ